jgi:hypothetical protein
VFGSNRRVATWKKPVEVAKEVSEFNDLISQLPSIDKTLAGSEGIACTGLSPKDRKLFLLIL